MTAFEGLTDKDLHTNGTFFSAIIFSEYQQSGLQAVINGEVDAAVISSEILNTEITEHRIAESDILVIHESPVIPVSTIAVNGDMSGDLKASVKEFLLGYENPDYFEHMNGMEPEDKACFIEAHDRDYDYIRNLMARVTTAE